MGLRPGMWLMTDAASWPVATPRFSNRWAADSSLTAGDGVGDDVDDVFDDDHVAADDQYGEPPVDGIGPQVLAGDVDCSTVPGGLDQIIVRTPPVRDTKTYFELGTAQFLICVSSIMIIIT